MKTVGQILTEARVSKRYSLEQVETATKIRRNFLEAIEGDAYHVLPSVSYAKGFVKNYAGYLGLDTATVMAFFRRQTIDIPRSSLLPKGMAEPLNKPFFRLTPGRFLGIVTGILAVLFLSYFGFQYFRLNSAPKLTIEEPGNEIVAAERRIRVLGTTDPDATVTINGVSQLVRSDGKFFDQVALETGINAITIVATSRFGKSTTVVRNVGLQQP